MVKKIKYLTHNFAQGVRFVNYMFYRFVSLTASKRAQEGDIQNGAERLSGAFFISNIVAFFKIGEKFSVVMVEYFVPALIIAVLSLVIMIHRLVYAKDKYFAIFAQFQKENKKSNKVIFYIYLLCSALIFWILNKL